MTGIIVFQVHVVLAFVCYSYANRHPTTHRPRLLLSGGSDQGQTSHLAPAVIHHLEQLPVHTLDLTSLYAVNARTPEESCAHVSGCMFIYTVSSTETCLGHSV